MMITVCMATYNGAKYIKEQVDSILGQLADDDELIVSDDGSTDATLEILSAYNDSRIKLFHHKKSDDTTLVNHQRVSQNFENAIKNASGDWIFLSDQDDIWAPNKVEECRKYFDSHDLIMSDCHFIKNDAVDYNSSYLRGRDPYLSFIGLKPNYHGCCLAFRSSFKAILLPFPKRLYVHDTWIGNLIRFKGRVKIINDKLVFYRLHSSNVSGKWGGNIIYSIKHRISTFWLLSLRLIKTIPS